MAESPKETRPAWWQFPWREIGSFALGSFILIWQTTFESSAQPILVGAGVALVGVTGAGAVQRAIRRVTKEQ